MPSLSNFPSSQVRKTFLDYFGLRSAFCAQNVASQVISQHQHKIVPSMSLLPPLNDPSLTFVNAGMNAWKQHFLGISDTSLPSSMIANAQKCVRISDIDLVGIDSYHHTFFEMLGSWSFNGAYTKEDACRMSWEFLTGPMALEKEKLYITYFNGSDQCECDNETREIWKSIGIQDSHLIGFGSADNFWEMGITGPCGPCTEIHYDHNNRGALGVNKGFSDLIELWNIVFIENERNIDGSLSALPNQHIDTGMGLERLCAIKNKTISNYNTDLFLPIFEEITRSTGAPPYKDTFQVQNEASKQLATRMPNCINTAYRVIGDHTRMISASLSDGFLPDTNHRLKYIIRRTLQTIESSFIPNSDKAKRAEILTNLCQINSDILGEQFPELYKNFDRVKIAIEYENEILSKREKSGKKSYQTLEVQHPELASLIDPNDANQFQDALKLLESTEIDNNKINGDLAYRLYDTVGLKENDIETLAKAKNLHFDRKDFLKSFSNAKSNSKLMSAIHLSKTMKNLNKIKATEDRYKYIFQRKTETHYAFPMIKAKILNIIDTNDQIDIKCSNISEEKDKSSRKVKGDKCGIILDKTTFYHEAGGQVGDKGILVGPNGATFEVEDCQKLEGTNLVLHIGSVTKGMFNLGLDVQVQIDTTHRIGCMQNHTATHLLNYVLHSTLPMTYQHSSRVDSNELKFDFSAYNVDFNNDMIADIEIKINNLIGKKADVDRRMIKAEDCDHFMATLSNSFDNNCIETTSSHEVKNESYRSNSNETEEIKAFENLKSEDHTTWEPRFISIPGQTYPNEINLINVCGSVEPCCGTHVQNTGDIQSFVVLNCKSAGKGSIKSLKCVSGHRAMEARTNGLNLLADVAEIAEELELLDEQTSTNIKNECTESLKNRSPKDIIKNIKTIKKAISAENSILPHTVKTEVEEILKELSRHLKKSGKATSKEKMMTELEEVLEDSTHLDYIVHFFTLDASNVRLSSFDNMCKDKPMLLMVLDNSGTLTARACVPQKYLSNFNEGDAMSWLLKASEIFTNNASQILNSKDIQIKAPKGQNAKEKVNMSPLKLVSNDKEKNVKTLENMAKLASKFATDTWS